MPFTFSHPAIVLPLYRLFRNWFSLTGLIVGSIIPDFEYFIRMDTKRTYSHSLMGMFWFDLPLAIAVCFIYHNLVRNVLLDQLPQILRSRLMGFTGFNWSVYFRRHWWLVILSILLGTFSHLVWDHFVHERGYALQFNSFLQEHITDEPAFPVPQYNTVQLLSSLIGGVIILYALYQLPVTTPESKPFNFRFWTIIGFIMLVVMIIRLLTGLHYRNYYNVVINSISSLFIALIIVSFYLRKKYYPAQKIN